jgi:hypothetical protein
MTPWHGRRKRLNNRRSFSLRFGKRIFESPFVEDEDRWGKKTKSDIIHFQLLRTARCYLYDNAIRTRESNLVSIVVRSSVCSKTCVIFDLQSLWQNPRYIKRSSSDGSGNGGGLNLERSTGIEAENKVPVLLNFGTK